MNVLKAQPLEMQLTTYGRAGLDVTGAAGS